MRMHRMLPYMSAILFATVVAFASPATAAAVGAQEQAGQAAPAAPAKPRLVAPVRGTAELNYTKPVIKATKIAGKDHVVTTFQVKNVATGAVAGLKIEEFWYNKKGDTVTGDTYRHMKPLQPGEVITVTLETPRAPEMDRNQYKFEHANGSIKMTLVPKL